MIYRHFATLTHTANPALIYETLYKGNPRTFIFESGSPGISNGQYSFLGSFNRITIKSFREDIEIWNRGIIERKKGNPVIYLQELATRCEFQGCEDINFFQGGMVGYLGYDLARFFESLPDKGKKTVPVPDLYFGVTDELIIIDHVKNTLTIIIDSENETTRKHVDERIQEIEDSLQYNDVPQNAYVYSAANLKSNLDLREFTGLVERTQKYIQEGDIFQVNLSQRFEADFKGSTWGYYKRLREINPSPYQGYMNFGDMQLVSASPERLVKVDKKTIETRPIAGTRPRGFKHDDDIRLSRDLILNEKERAEHLMLVDLERNDLGRICEYGSVKVEEFMGLEAYSHVWHIVSKVTGKIKSGINLLEILRACFPGGTITGCPKIRSMEIIEELEPDRRGFYTGSMGYIGWNGNVDFNILIRSSVIVDQKIFFNTGAGIVADSDPVSEYKETIYKAEAIIEALGLDFS